MKRCLLLAVCLTIAAVNTGFAVPRAAESTGKYYLLAAQDLSAWHVGGTYRQLERNVDLFGLDRKLKLSRAAFYVGVDVLPWVTVYGTIGSVDADLGSFPGDSDAGVAYGGGVWLNLLDHDLVQSLTLEHRLRVQALAQLTRGTPDYDEVSLNYNEFHSALTLTLINEIDGNKQFWPEAVTLFAGPAYSYLNGSRFDTRNDDFGLVMGSDVLLSRRINLSVRYETYGNSDQAISGSLNVRL